MDNFYRALDLLLNITSYAILARVLISWFPVSGDHPLVRLLYQITEPILGPIRAFLQKTSIGQNSMFDFTPLVAFFLIYLLRGFIRQMG